MESSLQYSHQSHGVPRALGTPGALQGNYTGALGAYPVLGIKKKENKKKIKIGLKVLVWSRLRIFGQEFIIILRALEVQHTKTILKKIGSKPKPKINFFVRIENGLYV